jgi:uncharacterized protein (DUF111 family)
MLLLVNIDDITGEMIPHIIDGLLSRGAESAHVVQAITKKGRPEFLFFIDAPEEQVETLANYLVREIGTLGVRVFKPHHIRFDYRCREVQLTTRVGEESAVAAPVQVKMVSDGEGQVVSIKAEYEDLQAAITQLHRSGIEISFAALKRLVEQKALESEKENPFSQAIQVECVGDDSK